MEGLQEPLSPPGAQAVLPSQPASSLSDGFWHLRSRIRPHGGARLPLNSRSASGGSGSGAQTGRRSNRESGRPVRAARAPGRSGNGDDRSGPLRDEDSASQQGTFRPPRGQGRVKGSVAGQKALGASRRRGGSRAGGRAPRRRRTPARHPAPKERSAATQMDAPHR